MAREMNVDKRIDALRQIQTRAKTNSARAKKIATELRTSFKDDKTAQGKQAREVAQRALKLATALDRVNAG